jgi:hypothetical protein
MYRGVQQRCLSRHRNAEEFLFLSGAFPERHFLQPALDFLNGQEGINGLLLNADIHVGK